MDLHRVRALEGGANQRGVRDYNERLIMSLIQRHGGMPGSEIAKRSNLSPQTVSVILRKLETDGLLQRGEPVRGRVGKPSTPMLLNKDGAYSIGMKIGRRSSDMALMDLAGNVLKQRQITYLFPHPEPIFTYLKEGIDDLCAGLCKEQRDRVSGIGIAAPFEMWNWQESLGGEAVNFATWRDVDFVAEIARFSDLPVFIDNDATAACRAEQIFGRGREFRNYAYFFIGSFVGGGVVMDHRVVEGGFSNAGAFGSLRSCDASGTDRPLIDTASLYLLETAAVQAGHDRDILWHQPQDWQSIEPFVQRWIDQASRELAKATHTVCCVIDFEAVLIDGAFPMDVRERLVAQTRRHIEALDMRGIITPRIEAGAVGENARVVGAASSPVFSQFFFKGGPTLAAG